MTKRQLKSILTIGVPLLVVLCIYTLGHLVRQRDTRNIVTQFATAQQALEKVPPGIERAEQFVRRVKAFNTGYAPA